MASIASTLSSVTAASSAEPLLDKAKQSEESMKSAGLMACPLFLLCIPISILSIIFNILRSLVVGLFGHCCADSPDASPAPAGTQPIPQTGPFVGPNMFSYFKFLKEGIPAYVAEMKHLGSSVLTFTVGRPSVGCLDVASSQALLDAFNPAHAHKHEINLKWDTTLFAGQCPNFIRNGETAVAARAFFRALIPETPDDRWFRVAVAEMFDELASWSDTSEWHDFDSGVNKLIFIFGSTLFLGRPLHVPLIQGVFPMPAMVPAFPWLPQMLMPPRQAAKVAIEALFEDMQESPRWEAIKAAADEYGLSAEEACANLLASIGFNTLGLFGPMQNAFYFLPMMPQAGQELLQDNELLESFAWELLRCCGPKVDFTTQSDLQVPTSDGRRHCVKAGTGLFTHFSIVTRDPNVWHDPDVFKVERFKPLPDPGLAGREGHSEPLPTLSFGCPLGKLLDKSSAENSHRCAFVHLAQPFMCEFVRQLLNGFSWNLSMPGSVADAAGEGWKGLEIPFSPELLRASAGDQNTPKTNGAQKCRIWKKP